MRCILSSKTASVFPLGERGLHMPRTIGLLKRGTGAGHMYGEPPPIL